MDKFNVISLTSDINLLESDMNDWVNMSYNKRLKSDEECRRLYNMSNVDLYNTLKSSILSNTISSDRDIIENCLLEGTLSNNSAFESITDDMFENKEQMSRQLELSTGIVIITPFRGNNKEYELNDLVEKYLKYKKLSDKNKMYSDSYSLDIWGYTVTDMYNIMRNRIFSIDGMEDDNFLIESVNSNDKFMEPVIENVYQKIISNDRLGLLLTKLDSCTEMGSYNRSVYEYMVPKINKVLEGDYNDAISTITPFFTLDEMEELCPDSSIVGDVDPEKYYSILNNEFKKYNNAASDEDKETISNNIISLGWNPSVELNERNIKFARDRQIKWLKEKCCKIVDLTKMKFDDNLLLESSSHMRNLYKKNNLYPVYIVLTYTNTPFGKVIRALKHSTYTHAGLCLDSDLQNIVTFKFGNQWNGFSTESLDFYLTVNDGALLDVLAIFVDDATKNKLQLAILDFVSKQEKTRYGFGNLFNILINRAKNDPENLALVCSQFVDVVLKIANIDLTNKSSNLVIPQDFHKISTNPKVYKVYEGLAKEYDERKIEASINSLFKTTPITQIKYNNMIDLATESFNPSSFYYITENKKANEILEDIRNLLTPEAVVFERKLPFKFNDKGDLAINFSKTLEQEYQESHKLLSSYSDENIEGIKHELARLFYINCTIEKKIKKMKKDDDQYKPIIDLRARVLNDFKKYMKVVLKKEPEFNFNEYFKASEYYDSSIVIDNSTMKFLGSLIKKIISKI